ncbi:MAG TPA: dTDP-glucose 4,6-dehydratase [Nocardiopsis listeri]|uniref:dTDP-glucose 4,6-dehydratase n=1 Tax=Nocardiopsis listeri TaxID=53440 RepID=UPI001DAEEA4D|nr:dTDP-glucose 4,6-dehydratase [Nocardiopsis listeri]HJE57221.1 dTDP-glucose 4,6-dehydratase [Nocardiopsis listeri]
MRIMVTGGAGFIGSHFLHNLLDGRYPDLPATEVVVVDKLTYAGDHRLFTGRVDPRIRFAEIDICDPTVDELMKGVDLVVHFAAESHVDRSIVDSAAFVRTNVLGTQNLLECALRNGVGKFVHVSTDEVYGSIAKGSWDEWCPLEPNSPYAASKAASDLLVRSYHRTHGLDVSVTRCSNNYGSRQYPEKLIPRFVTNLSQGRSVPLYGDGSNVREWLHVSDHCWGVALVAKGGRPGEVYNIGGGSELTNRELADILVEHTGADPSLVVRSKDRLGHDLRYSVDYSKMFDEFGYEPRVEISEGLRSTVEWYRENQDWWEGFGVR